MKPYILSASIVLYNTPAEDLRKCITSLMNYSGRCLLFVIDNSPEPKLEAECKNSLVHEYIHLPSNPGFGAGHNVAIAKAQTAGSLYHLVINADVSFSSDILSPMLTYMQQHPEVGQMMPKILNPDGTVQRLCKLVPSPSDLLLRRLLTQNLKELRNRRFELHDTGYNKTMFVPYLSGCFMLLRNSTLKEVGLFDERYFMYPEDIDLTRRIAERHETIFFPQVCATHKHGAASHKSFKMFLIHLINICKYFNKWGWFYDPIRVRLNEKTLNQSFSN